MIKVYKDESNNYVCELWGASTKHPDTVFYMEDFKMASWVETEKDVDTQVFQWLLECASKLIFPFHAKELVEYALENWYNWE